MPAEHKLAERKLPSLTEQATWLLVAKVIGFMISIAAPLVVVRVLGQKEFGLYKQVYLILATGIQLLTFGFHMNLFYFLPRRPAIGNKLVLNVLLVQAGAGFITMAVLLAYPELLSRMGSPELVRYGRALAVALFLNIAGYLLEVVATANQEVKYSAIFVVLAQLTKGTAMVAAALIAGSIEWLLSATIFQALAQLAMLGWYITKKFPHFLSAPDWQLFREQVSYSLPFTLVAFATLIQTYFHQFVIAQRFSAADYALYAVGCTSLPLIGLIRESVNSVMIPRVSYLQQHGEHRQLAILLAAATRKLSFVYLPVFAFLTVAAEDFLALLYTAPYIASKPIFLVNLLTLLLIVPSDPVNRAFPEYRGFLLRVRLTTTILLIPGVYGGIKWFGMVGAITAVVIAMLADYAIVTFKAGRTLGITARDLPLFSDSAKIGASAGVASIAIKLLYGLLPFEKPLFVLISAGTLFSVAYLGLLILTGVPNSDEIAALRRKLPKVFTRPTTPRRPLILL